MMFTLVNQTLPDGTPAITAASAVYLVAAVFALGVCLGAWWVVRKYGAEARAGRDVTAVYSAELGHLAAFLEQLENAETPAAYTLATQAYLTAARARLARLARLPFARPPHPDRNPGRGRKRTSR